ncbi:MAG: EamA family transporter [DPANN group archaeon]|nr:EamA family transporter [DPANN group archaeon]
MTELWAVGLVLGAVAFGSFGPLFLKRGADLLDFKLRKNLWKGLQVVFSNVDIYLGLGFYGISSVLFVYALRGGELSVLYPLVATSYIWTSLLSVKFLREKMNSRKWTGILFIILGVALIGFGSAL